MKRIARSAIVPHSAAQLYGLVEDIESYPAFLPWCVGAEVKSRDGGETLATLTNQLLSQADTANYLL